MTAMNDGDMTSRDIQTKDNRTRDKGICGTPNRMYRGKGRAKSVTEDIWRGDTEEMDIGIRHS